MEIPHRRRIRFKAYKAFKEIVDPSFKKDDESDDDDDEAMEKAKVKK